MRAVRPLLERPVKSTGLLAFLRAPAWLQTAALNVLRSAGGRRAENWQPHAGTERRTRKLLRTLRAGQSMAACGAPDASAATSACAVEKPFVLLTTGPDSDGKLFVPASTLQLLATLPTDEMAIVSFIGPKGSGKSKAANLTVQCLARECCGDSGSDEPVAAPEAFAAVFKKTASREGANHGVWACVVRRTSQPPVLVIDCPGGADFVPGFEPWTSAVVSCISSLVVLSHPLKSSAAALADSVADVTGAATRLAEYAASQDALSGSATTLAPARLLVLLRDCASCAVDAEAAHAMLSRRSHREAAAGAASCELARALPREPNVVRLPPPGQAPASGLGGAFEDAFRASVLPLVLTSLARPAQGGGTRRAPLPDALGVQLLRLCHLAEFTLPSRIRVPDPVSQVHSLLVKEGVAAVKAVLSFHTTRLQSWIGWNRGVPPAATAAAIRNVRSWVHEAVTQAASGSETVLTEVLQGVASDVSEQLDDVEKRAALLMRNARARLADLLNTKLRAEVEREAAELMAAPESPQLCGTDTHRSRGSSVPAIQAAGEGIARQAWNNVVRAPLEEAAAADCASMFGFTEREFWPCEPEDSELIDEAPGASGAGGSEDHVEAAQGDSCDAEEELDATFWFLRTDGAVPDEVMNFAAVSRFAMARLTSDALRMAPPALATSAHRALGAASGRLLASDGAGAPVPALDGVSQPRDCGPAPGWRDNGIQRIASAYVEDQLHVCRRLGGESPENVRRWRACAEEAVRNLAKLRIEEVQRELASSLAQIAAVESRNADLLASRPGAPGTSPHAGAQPATHGRTEAAATAVRAGSHEEAASAAYEAPPPCPAARIQPSG